jgi:hypothetical protein
MQMQRRKLQEDPLGVTADGVDVAFYSLWHPVDTVQTLCKYIYPAVDAFFKSLKLSWWIKDPVPRGTPATK